MRSNHASQSVNLALAIVSPIIMLALWEICANFGIVSVYAFSKPSVIGVTLIADIQSSSFWTHVWVSIFRLAIGTSIGVAIGIGLAFLVYLNRIARSAIAPTLSFASSFPPMVWAPLAIAAFGTGEISKVTFIGVTAIFVEFAAVYRGLVSIDGRLIEALTTLPRPIWTKVSKIYWPGALPHTLDGMKTSLTFGWIALLFAEMMGSENGLGWLLWDSRTFGRAPEMMVCLLAIGVLGKFSVDFIDRLAKTASPWYGQYRAELASGGKNGGTIGRKGDKL